MKKTIILLFLGFLCLPVCVFCASISGVETQGKSKFSIGVDGECVFDRDMEFESFSPIPSDEKVELKSEIDKIYREMVKVSYGVFDNWDIYLRLGNADFQSRVNYDWHHGPGFLWRRREDLKIKGNDALAYGIGMKGRCQLKSDWIAGCDIQYLRYENDYKGTSYWSEYDPNGNITLLGEMPVTGRLTFQEWHFAAYIAKRLGDFLPYIGVKYSDLRTKYKLQWVTSGDKEKLKFEADCNVGVFVGTDYKIGKKWKLNLEGRFIDETAVSLAAVYKF